MTSATTQRPQMRKCPATWWTWVPKLLSRHKRWERLGVGKQMGRWGDTFLKTGMSWYESEEYSDRTLKLGTQLCEQRQKQDLTSMATAKPGAGVWVFAATSGLRTGDNAQGPGQLGSPRDVPSERRACRGLQTQSKIYPK